MKKKYLILSLMILLIIFILPNNVSAATYYTKTIDSTQQLRVKTKKNVKWISSDTSIATVTQKGLVKFKQSGYVLIIATYGSSTQSWLFKVIPAKQQIVYEHDISLPVGLPKKQTLCVGDQTTLLLNGVYHKTEPKWSSSNRSVATINKNGLIRAKGVGTSKITAKINGKYYHCNLVVVKRSLAVNKNVLKLYVGETKKVTVTLKSNDSVYCTTDKADITGSRFSEIMFPIMDCEFGNFKGDNIELSITGTEPGRQYLYIATEASKEVVIVQVNVYEKYDF